MQAGQLKKNGLSMLSVRETGRDDAAKHNRSKNYTFHFQFPVLDFLLFSTIIRCEMSSTQIIKCISDLCDPTMLPPPSTIRSRLNILAHGGFLAYRQESVRRPLYFSITNKGKGQLHEMCSLVQFLNEMAKTATVELAGYLLALRRPRSAEAPGPRGGRT